MNKKTFLGLVSSRAKLLLDRLDAAGDRATTRRISVGGNNYIVRGPSEEVMLITLLRNHPDTCTPSGFAYPEDTYARTKGFPDFYLPSLDNYVECKSTWTFFGKSTKVDHLARNLKRAKRYGPDVRWVIHAEVDGADKFLTLPSEWWELGYVGAHKQLTTFLKRYTCE